MSKVFNLQIEIAETMLKIEINSVGFGQALDCDKPHEAALKIVELLNEFHTMTEESETAAADEPEEEETAEEEVDEDEDSEPEKIEDEEGDEIIDIDQVAEMTSLAKTTISNKIFNDRFPDATHKIGKKNAWRKEDVQHWIDTNPPPESGAITID